MRTIESKTNLIDSEYIKIEEHEKIVNEKLNALTQEFTISRMQLTSQFEKEILALKQEYEKEIADLS